MKITPIIKIIYIVVLSLFAILSYKYYNFSCSINIIFLGIFFGLLISVVDKIIFNYIYNKIIILDIKYYIPTTYKLNYKFIFVSMIIGIIEEISIRRYNSLFINIIMGLLHYFDKKTLYNISSKIIIFIILQFIFNKFGIICSIVSHLTYNLLISLTVRSTNGY